MASESWLAALKHMYMRPYNNVEQFSLITCKANCVKHQLALLLFLGWRRPYVEEAEEITDNPRFRGHQLGCINTQPRIPSLQPFIVNKISV